MSIITASLAKAWCQIPDSASDEVMTLLIAAAQEQLERHCAVKFVTTTYATVTESIDGGESLLWPSWHPIRTVTTVTDVDLGESFAEFGNDTWKLYRNDATRWPSGTNRWQITYTAGYKATETPEALKMAALIIVKRLYDNRASMLSLSSDGLSMNFGDLALGSDWHRMVQPYRHVLPAR